MDNSYDVLIDEELERLEREIRQAKVTGSFFARIFVRTGLNAAADVIEKRRCELLCEGIVKGNGGA